MIVREVPRTELAEVMPILLLAEPSMSALRSSLGHLSDTVYRMDDPADGGRTVAAATMRWRSEPCELVELGVAADRQGQGLGKRMVAWLVGEARRRGKQRVIVGTSNASIGNIAFYQKCGFRLDSVRHDYFWYHDEPIYEHGIRVRDMLVLRYDLEEIQPPVKRSRRR